MVGSTLLMPEIGAEPTDWLAPAVAAERVVIRLHGRRDDVRSAAARLRIDLNWDRAERLPDDACSVEGRLDLAESPRLFL